MSNFSKHIDFAVIADLVEGRVAANVRTESMAHMSSCTQCAEKFRRLDQALQ